MTPTDSLLHSDGALARLAQARDAFLSDFDAFPPAQRAEPAADGGWSAVAIAEHLVRSEGGALAIVERGVETGRDLGPTSEEALARVEAMLESDRRVPMPEAFAGHLTPQGMPEREAREALASFGARWAEAAARLTPETEASGVFSHPAAGPLSLAGAARFTAAHLAHHRHQVGRLRRSLGLDA